MRFLQVWLLWAAEFECGAVKLGPFRGLWRVFWVGFPPLVLSI